jgi:hypothetical protein
MWDSDGQSYVIVPLLGRIKCEINDKDLLLPCVTTKSSGVDVKSSLE